MDALSSIGLQGIKQGLTKANSSASAITQSFEQDLSVSTITDHVVGLKLSELQVYASSKILKVSDELQDSLLNLIA